MDLVAKFMDEFQNCSSTISENYSAAIHSSLLIMAVLGIHILNNSIKSVVQHYS